MPNSSAAYFADRMLRGLGLSEASVPAVPFKAKIQAPLSLMSRALASGTMTSRTPARTNVSTHARTPGIGRTLPLSPSSPSTPSRGNRRVSRSMTQIGRAHV